MRRSIIHFSLLSLLLVLTSACEKTPVPSEDPDQTVLMPYREAVQSLGAGLKGELQKAMKAGGPLAAIEVCQQKALPITQDVSNAQADGWIVRRTSAKLRNPANTPLTEQEAAHINSADFTADSEILEVVQKDGKPHHLYMKAINVNNPVCLNCHGADIKPELAAKINQLYPMDKATGYQLGDVRGAFVVYAPIEE